MNDNRTLESFRHPLSEAERKDFFVVLHRECATKVFDLLMNVLKKDVNAVKDTMQETFRSAWEQLDSIGPEVKPAAWVMLIAKNKAFDLLRYRKRWHFDFIEDQQYTSEQPDAEYMLERAERLEKIVGLSKELQPKHQQIFIAIYLEQLSVKETAVRLGMTTKNVSCELYRIKIKLRKLCKESGITTEDI